MSQQATLNNYFLRQKKPEAPEIKAKPAVQPYVKPEPRMSQPALCLHSCSCHACPSARWATVGMPILS